MEKTYSEQKGKKYAHGALILLFGGIFCKFIGAFYRIPLSNILGAEGIGIYQLIFPVYSLFLVFASGGVSVSLSKIVAECRARGETKRAKRFLSQSLIYLLVVATIFSLLFFLLAGQVATVQGNPLAKLGYFGVAGAIFFACILTAFRGYFQGHQNMLPTALSQIIEQIVKLLFGLFFASYLMKYGVEYGVLGAVIGIALSEFLSFVYLLISYFLHRKKKDVLDFEITTKYWEDFKLLIKKSLPIMLNSIILPLILAIDSFLIINLLLRTGLDNSISTQMFGVYSGMVNSLINFPTIVSLSLAISLIPAISYNKEAGKSNSDLISSTMKIILFVALPCILIFLFFSNEIMRFLYPNVANFSLLNMGATLLKISSINILYISLLQVSTAILQANNKSIICLINLIFAGIIKIVLTICFVLSPLSIYGAAISSILCFAFASGLNIITLKNEFNFSVSIKKIGYIFLASGLMLGISLGLNYLFNLFISGYISLFLSLLFAGILYLFLTILLPIFDDNEFEEIPFGKKIVSFRNKCSLKRKIKEKS